MPFVHIRISGTPLSQGGRRDLQDEATRLVATLLREKPELTTMLIEEPPGTGWAISAAPVSRAAFLEVSVTEGTNSPAEKARFIASAHALLEDVAGGGLDPATYVVVRELPAENWGYGGKTQAERRAAAASAA